MATKIRWQKSDRHARETIGYVGQWHAARVIETMSAKMQPFQWRCFLPVHEPVGFAPTFEEAKEAAERHIAAWLVAADLEQRA